MTRQTDSVVKANPARHRNEIDISDREAAWNAQDAEAERAKKNAPFIQVYLKTGSPMIRGLIELNPTAARLFLYLAENMDRTNAVVASGVALADALETSQASVSRAIRVLIKERFIERFQSGGTNVFVANPEIVWSAWATGKTTCMFNNAKVLLSKNEQDKTTRRHVNMLMEKRLANPEPAAQEPNDEQAVDTQTLDMFESAETT